MENTTLTVNEAAEYLRVHPCTIRRHIKSGEVPAFRVGGVWRLDKESIDSWKREQEQRNGSGKARLAALQGVAV
ncbi:MAG: helix-turn-helix domain-containing protein [Deltaproteobacteria bacterium]|jgi:excisionase family DNA binding protein|nr:helix-turn-helix domain-containing protein [Deltaproteobacteria bacterium]